MRVAVHFDILGDNDQINSARLRKFDFLTNFTYTESIEKYIFQKYLFFKKFV